MKIFRKISDVIVDILIGIMIILLVFSVYNYIQLNILGNQYVNYFGYTYFEVLTGSMEDEINIDDYVIVKINDEYDANDVISFYSDGEVITHRVVEINDGNIVTKGDANNANDEGTITDDDVIGKVVYVAEDLGKYVGIITEPIVFVPFLVAVILFNIAFSGNRSNRKEGSSIDEEAEKKE